MTNQEKKNSVETGVRLHKVASTLNIGIDSICDFLHGKSAIGCSANLTLNSKITEEQYNALKKEYQQDATFKKKADDIISQINERISKPKTKKENKKEIKVSMPCSNITFSGNYAIITYKKKLCRYYIFEYEKNIILTLKKQNISIIINTQKSTFRFEKDIRKLKKSINSQKQVEDPQPLTIKNTPSQERGKKQSNLNRPKRKRFKIDKDSILQKEVKLPIILSNITFSGNNAIITYEGETYSSLVTRYHKKILLTLGKKQIVHIIANTQKNTFRFEMDVMELMKSIKSQEQSVNFQPLMQQKTKLQINNIEFRDHYYLIWVMPNGKKDLSIIPLKVADNNSLHCLRLIHKYFSDRFPKNIEIIYNSQRVISLTQPYTLGKYIKILNANVDEHGEWWEMVQNERKATLPICKKTPLTQICRELSLRNCYLDYLAGIPNQKTVIKVYEVRQNQLEDVFIFTVSVENNRYAVIFENISYISTATWIFIMAKDYYEECITRIFDYFTNYELHNKRQSLTKSLNPPQKFKAEEYYKIMHDDLKGWIKRLNDILVREIPLNRIHFNPGLHIAKEVVSRSSRSEKIKVQYLHNELMRRLYYYLSQQYGEKNVGTENHIGSKKIDVVVKIQDGYNIYEIKTDNEPRDCVRKAMGQLMEYAYFECADVVHKMIVVGMTQETNEVNTYLSKFRAKNSLEIYYMSI